MRGECDKDKGKNLKPVIEAVAKARPSSAKGTFLENVTLAATTLPGATTFSGLANTDTETLSFNSSGGTVTVSLDSTNAATLTAAAATLDFQPEARRPLLVKPLKHRLRNA